MSDLLKVAGPAGEPSASVPEFTVANMDVDSLATCPMPPLSTFNRIGVELVGMKVSHLWRGHGSAIFLEFGELSQVVRRDGSPANPMGEITIGIEWSWRIENATSIICGSWSKEELWAPAFDLVRQSHVTALSIFGRIPEIDLALADNLHLVSFMTAEDQPEWHLADRRSPSHTYLSVRNGVLFESDGTVTRD